MLIKIINVTVETVPSGKGRSYEKAVVTYDSNGREQNFSLMSFTNPAVFKTIKDSTPGQEFDVTVGKNDKGYNTWTAVALTTTGSTQPGKPASTTVARSTYETPEERKLKQLYIIKQSSISNAIQYIKELNNEEPASVEYVLDVAQKFVDWIYDIPLEQMDNDL
jgi:hypothetical protein